MEQVQLPQSGTETLMEYGSLAPWGWFDVFMLEGDEKDKIECQPRNGRITAESPGVWPQWTLSLAPNSNTVIGKIRIYLVLSFGLPGGVYFVSYFLGKCSTTEG